MNRFPLSFSSLRARWRAGLPLRYTMMVVVVVAVRIEDRLANTPELERVRPDYGKTLATETTAGSLTRRTQTVVRSGEVLGTLVVWFDATYGQGLLQARRSQMLSLVALQVLAILAVLMPVLESRVLRPIERLKEQASALDRKSTRLNSSHS